MSKIKAYDVCLPVYKQGDDFRHYLEQCDGNVSEAFTQLAAMYQLAADTCKDISSFVANVENVKASGDCHFICIEGPADKLEPLVGFPGLNYMEDPDVDDEEVYNEN